MTTENKSESGSGTSAGGTHTPGPWSCWIERDLPGGLYWSIGRRDQPPIDIHESQNGEADARLIAAAPDLLAALQCFVSDARFHVAVGGNPIVVDRMLDTARAAIAKATGSQS